MRDIYVKSDQNKKIKHIDAKILYGHSKSQPLIYDEIKYDKNVKLQYILNAPNNSDIGYFVEIDLTYPDKIKQKSKHFPFAPENKKYISDNFTTYMNKNKSITYTQAKKLKCDWSVKKKSLIQYRMLEFYVENGLIVEKFMR